MKKTLMVAATLLTLGVGSAFAADRDAGATQAQPAQTTASQPAATQRLLFPTRTSRTVDVYPQFGYAGLNGGEQ